MQVSTRGRYGLRAMVDMALHATDGPIALRMIAERQDISESYLEQVFASLRKAGLVQSSRGAQGGYQLSRPAKEITVREILSTLEGPIAPVQCVQEQGTGTTCKREPYCITRSFWEELRDKINEFLDSTTLQDLCDRSPGISAEQLMYYI